MTFNQNIPQATDRISDSQGQLLGNNMQVDTAFGVDHTKFSVNSNVGMHKQVSLQVPLGGNPGQAGSIATVYTKAAPSSGTSDLYFQQGTMNNGVQQMTGGGISAAAWAAFNGNPNPVTILSSYNISSITGGGSGVYTVNFSRNFANTNYLCIGSVQANGIATFATFDLNGAPSSVSSFTFRTLKVTTGSAPAFPNPYICVVFYGVLA